MTLLRRFAYATLVPVGMGMVRLFWHSCRVVEVRGAASLEGRLFGGQSAVICYWHRHQLFCWRYLRQLIDRGARVGWLISESLDGEVPSRVAERMGGGIVFRGSTTSGGARALRSMCKGLVRDRISMATTPDGPSGPRSKFKPGIVKLAQLSGVPLVPVAWAARRAWVLKTWDRFVVPRPFTTIVVAVGEPVSVPRDADDVKVEQIQRVMEDRLQALFESARSTNAP
jgi:lysophospholipid acyltransferase (LPLAT)-like uncharacterized protein